MGGLNWGWLQGLGWGTVPAWASAFLTSGSLLLGFYILLRDRRKEERQEAAQVICWLERTAVLPDDRCSYTPRVANLAERPVSGVHLVMEHHDPDALEGRRVVMTTPIAPLIRPGEEESLSSGNEVTVAPLAVIRLVVTFLDADGTEWIRDLMPDLVGPTALHPATLSGKYRWPFKHSHVIRNMQLTLRGSEAQHLTISSRRLKKRLRRAR
ncbi:hypothetical protein [Streptomyces netropsis]|uniref:Uncharacterized protein n=1 Tax=Streptomyces netropsis TaxID=55404 RepID=A0A7W7LIM4_STRNE|nr:hypothetical protein [Streptomyces netropsis]MBB4890398.1 hypothetical protein [Streptomyces netropsis]GGR46237.1 hypothetical protein GCM10010219_59810 [Streptomyces netropsis]